MEFERVRGQIESLWNEGLTEAGVRARRSGEAAGVERVFREIEYLTAEWSSHPGVASLSALVPELRRRLSLPEPVAVDDGVERLTFAEWEERARREGWAHALDKGPELPPDEVIEVDEQGRVHGAVPGPLREGPDMRPGFRVGDIAEPPVSREGDEERQLLVDRRGGEAPQPEIAPDFEAGGEESRPLGAVAGPHREWPTEEEREGERARQLAAADAEEVWPPASPLPIREAQSEAEAAAQGDMVADRARERSAL